MKIFSILVEIMTLLGMIAMAVGVIIAITYNQHSGAVVASIGMIAYLVNIIYKNRRVLFEGEF